MGVYGRISNPFMPQGTSAQTNSPSPAYAPGEIGQSFLEQDTGQVCLRVFLDSGATSATPVGAVSVGQLAYWKDQVNNIVTNDSRFADVGPAGAINRVAGIFQLAVSTAPGVNSSNGQPVQYYCDLIIQKKQAVVACSTALIGAQATANTAANTANVVYTTGVTTAPPSQVIGVFASSTIAGGLGTVDVNIGFLD